MKSPVLSSLLLLYIWIHEFANASFHGVFNLSTDCARYTTRAMHVKKNNKFGLWYGLAPKGYPRSAGQLGYKEVSKLII
jgi:hypothetical protein